MFLTFFSAQKRNFIAVFKVFSVQKRNFIAVLPVEVFYDYYLICSSLFSSKEQQISYRLGLDMSY
jgi:hypothetical protein